MGMRGRLLLIIGVLAAAVGLTYRIGIPPIGKEKGLEGGGRQGGRQETVTVERTEYTAPRSPWDDLLADDRLEEKQPAFDPLRVHPRKVEGWTLNLSDAVLRLDVPVLKPDQDAKLLVLHPSYAEALKAAKAAGGYGVTVLPSANLLDGLAKQFDDGLYAALDRAYYSGRLSEHRGQVELVKRIEEALPRESPARPFVAAGLSLAGVEVEGVDRERLDAWLRPFEAAAFRSKPIGFYTWDEELRQCFRFLRFFQHVLARDDRLAVDLGQAVRSDPRLAADYAELNAFYARLTNPLKHGTVMVAGTDQPGPRTVALFPASTSREGELFEALFGDGLPPDADLMRELITRIRSGAVDLRPGPESGWYAHQVYSLETLLLPEKGQENQKLLLTKGYKRRMLEAFQALMTKRRETHVRQLDIPLAAAAPLRELKVRPELRVEPALTFYLRTARAYAFLEAFLDSAIGSEGLRSLRGLREGGERPVDLGTELRTMRERFYGFYLVGCEDIGMAPELASDEPVDQAACVAAALDWLKDWENDPDLAVDTRVSVPIMVDVARGVTRLWATLGVRLSRLEVDYARGPMARVADDAEWERLHGDQLEGRRFLIAVDDFAEFELSGGRVLTRDELRAICNREKTRERILKALR